MKRIISNAILIFLVLVIGLISIMHWEGCWKFVDQFYSTQHMRENALLLLTNGEQGVPIFIVRMFFNKIAYLPWSIVQGLLQYWDVRFLQRFVGVVGGIGVFLGIWYFFTKNNKNVFLWILFLGGILIPIFEMLVSPSYSYGYQLLPLYIIFQLFSLFGIWQFLKANRSLWRYAFVIMLILFSIIYLIYYPNAYQTYCIKV